MNPEVRRELLRVLDDLGEYTPDVRFGQLLANLSYITLANKMLTNHTLAAYCAHGC